MGSKYTYEENIERSNRLRTIRENLKLTQEAMAEVLEISVDAYGKIENGINGVSYNVLSNYKKNLGISADYILFGDYASREEVWDLIMNCKEKDKMFLMFQLVNYFSQSKKTLYTLKEEDKSKDMITEFLNQL